MPLYTAEYNIKVEVALGSHASMFEAEIFAEKLAQPGYLLVLRSDAGETPLKTDITMIGLGESPQERAQDRLALKRALHGFIQGYADLGERGEHIPFALQSAYQRAAEVLGLAPKGEKPKAVTGTSFPEGAG